MTGVSADESLQSIVETDYSFFDPMLADGARFTSRLDSINDGDYIYGSILESGVSAKKIVTQESATQFYDYDDEDDETTIIK